MDAFSKFCNAEHGTSVSQADFVSYRFWDVKGAPLHLTLHPPPRSAYRSCYQLRMPLRVNPALVLVPGLKLADKKEATDRVYLFFATEYFQQMAPVPGAHAALTLLVRVN